MVFRAYCTPLKERIAIKLIDLEGEDFNLDEISVRQGWCLRSALSMLMLSSNVIATLRSSHSVYTEGNIYYEIMRASQCSPLSYLLCALH